MTTATLSLHLHQVTDRAILVSRTNDAETAVWLRTSEIAFEAKPEDLVTVICPETLARERSLL